MATIDEILDALPEVEGDAREYLVIDPTTRTISVPEAERILGVETDEDAERKYFISPRYVGDGLDLAAMFLTVNYRNANGEADSYPVQDVVVQGDYVTFSWKIAPKVVAYKGLVQFSVSADLPNTPDRRGPAWNTTIATGESLEGLNPDHGDVAGETSDVVTALRAMVTAQTAAVEAAGAAQVQTVQAAGAAATAEAETQVEAKGAATLATIPADYTTLANKTNEQANAIKGHLSGEIIQAGDVSPVEHYLGVKIHGKNLFNAKGFSTFTSDSSPYISEIGNDYIVLSTPESYAGNGVSYPNIRLCDLCPGAVAGRVYTFSFKTDSSVNDYMYLSGAKYSIASGKTYTFTKEMLESNIHPYGFSAERGEGPGDCVISNIQLEEGTAATEYTPYIDPAGVTVTRYGADETDNPQTYTPLDDGSVPGVVSMAPTMTLLADTAGVTIDCTYNRDTNAVLAEVLAKIAALSGTT